MRNIVISGATGFLGVNLLKKFLDQGCKVWAIVRPESKNIDVLPKDRENLQIVFLSIFEKEKIIKKIGKADAWFHFAWGGVNRKEIDSEEVQNRNIQMSCTALNIAYELGCNVFMDAGSRVEYGIVNGVMEEHVECQPINEYGKAKLEFYKRAVELCCKYNMKYCHLRFFSVYGQGDHEWSIISTLLHELPAGKKVSLSACRHQWNFMYIQDAVNAVYQLYCSIDKIENFESGIFNIASEDTRVLRDFVEEIYKITGEKGELEFGSFTQAKEGALSVIPDISALKMITDGWKEKYSFRQGILETLERECRKDEEN